MGFFWVLLFSVVTMAQTSQSNRPPADQEGPSDSALIRALVTRNEHYARQLLDSGASPNQKDRFGATPLAVTILLHNSDFAEVLIQKGADVNLVEDHKGTSPLMTAARYCDMKTAKLLLERGAVVNHRDENGETALGSAADACKDGDMLKLLIAHGAQINVKTDLGRTPLIEASFNGNEPAVRELVQAGADLNIKDNDGATAQSSACGRLIGREQSHDKICAFLRNVGSQGATN